MKRFTIVSVYGDIFTSGAEALVNPVNCVGVSGKGLALEFRKRFPHAHAEYVDLCNRGLMKIGTVWARPAFRDRRQPTVVHFPTKDHWRERSLQSHITSGLVAMRQLIEREGYRSIAVPALGCGHGGLDWDWVRPRIEEALGGLEEGMVQIYEPRLT